MKTSQTVHVYRIISASRIYHTTVDAAAAVGISPNHFRRLCKKFGVETPAQRRQREKVELRRYREEKVA